MESFALKNPETIKQEMDKLADQMSEAKYKYNLLDSNTKVIFSKLCLEAKNKYNCSMAEAEKHGYVHPDYSKHLAGLATASSEYDRIKAKFNNYVSYVEYMRSYISAQKHLN
jgi:uncharacterized protein YlxP (DUF503 family)